MIPIQTTSPQIESGTDGNPNGSENEIWYLALKQLHIVQVAGAVPSTIRFAPGQRFTLDGDERGLDIEGLIRVRAVKIYEDADAEWAQARLAERPKPTRRKRNNG